MSNNIDIHQLDCERQVLFILDEAGSEIPVEQIRDGLVNHRISPETKEIKSILSNTIKDARRKFIKDGLVLYTDNRYQIMQKGIEYLKSTVIVIDPSGEKRTQETVGHILANLSGDIKLCDPYFDDTAYQLLNQYLNPEKINSINIIYSKNNTISAKSRKIGNHVIELKKGKIHDRFIIDKNHLYLLGTSLNSIGSKLSFIFNLTVYKDIFDKIFLQHWNSS